MPNDTSDNEQAAPTAEHTKPSGQRRRACIHLYMLLCLRQRRIPLDDAAVQERLRLGSISVDHAEPGLTFRRLPNHGAQTNARQHRRGETALEAGLNCVPNGGGRLCDRCSISDANGARTAVLIRRSSYCTSTSVVWASGSCAGNTPRPSTGQGQGAVRRRPIGSPSGHGAIVSQTAPVLAGAPL